MKRVKGFPFNGQETLLVFKKDWDELEWVNSHIQDVWKKATQSDLSDADFRVQVQELLEGLVES